MSLDPRSRERLAALGRTLPQKLPTPQASPPTDQSAPRFARRHRLETEQDPEALFRELITASADGSVPSHLLDRLRDLEARQPRQPRFQAGPVGAAGVSTAAVADARAAKPSRQAQRPGSKASRRPRLDPEQQALYSAFEELLQDEDPEA
ncbi:MAG: hypothetical protein VKK97_00915 [Synechococcaceae cyanobacterium]|nr:hypothetical protein [Synechococcaceae cyanobacterium]